MRTSAVLYPVFLLLLVSCSVPALVPPDGSPFGVRLTASRLEGEAEFGVTFLALAAAQDPSHLTYSWRVNNELVLSETGPKLDLTFFEAGSYEVAVRVRDAAHEAYASVTVTARNEYRPVEAPDVVIVGFAGRCNVLECHPPHENRAYLSDAPLPNTLRAIELTFQTLGYTTRAHSFRSHLLDSPTRGPGYWSAATLLESVRDEWIRDFRDTTQVVLVGHSHGTQFMSLLAWDHPEIPIAYAVYLDAVCALWDADHVHSGRFDAVYGPRRNFPAPLSSLGAACDVVPVPGVGLADISDVVPWNVARALEVRSNGVGLSGVVLDDDDNYRPDGTSGYHAGLESFFQFSEGHSRVAQLGSQGLQWVLDKIRLYGLTQAGPTAHGEPSGGPRYSTAQEPVMKRPWGTSPN